MAATVFVLDVVATFLLSVCLLHRYGDWMRQRAAVTLAVLIAWYFSFLIVFLLPLDVSSTSYKQCLKKEETERREAEEALLASNQTTVKPGPSMCAKPYSLLAPQTLPDLWKVVYWSSQLLTWLVLPLMQSYTQAGEFKASGKIKAALWDNAIFYLSYATIALVLVLYMAAQPDIRLNWEQVKAIAASASNTWGLFVLVLMMGYGLVEVPRLLWNSAQRGYMLDRAYFKAAKLMTEKSDAEDDLDGAVAAAVALRDACGAVDPRRELLDVVLARVPIERLDRARRRAVEPPPTEAAAALSEKSLARLHRRVITAAQNFHRTEAQWADLTQTVFHLEDVARNMISNEHVFKRSNVGGKQPSTLVRMLLNPQLEWYLRCLAEPLVLRCLAGVAALMSFLVLWSEVTFFVKEPPLSLLALFVGVAQMRYDYLAIEAICFVTICYLSICTYYTVFKIRVLNYYYLAKNHQSDEYTLLFSGNE